MSSPLLSSHSLLAVCVSAAADHGAESLLRQHLQQPGLGQGAQSHQIQPDQTTRLGLQRQGDTIASVQALHWFSQAANGGHAAGLFQLAMAYRTGNGVPQDPVAANALMLLAQVSDGGSDFAVAAALLRWDSVALGSVPPAEFIAVAEETGLIKPIGAWVLEQACAAWVHWQALAAGDDQHPLHHRQISVNISASQLADPELVPFLQGLLARTGMNPQCLELEITESQLMDNAVAAQAQMAALKALGLQLSIDDFGTGYSSLAYLKRLPVDELKIDKSFVMGMEAGEDDAMIVRSTIDLAHNLGLTVVAEGVETAAILERLRALACDEAQGYHITRPLPVEDFLAWQARQG